MSKAAYPGRPSQITPAIIDKFMECIKAGHSRAEAAQMAGVEDSTVRHWMKRADQKHPLIVEFRRRVNEIEAARGRTRTHYRRHLIYSVELADKVISLVRRGRTVTDAAREIGGIAGTIYYWKDRHPEFATRLQEARHLASTDPIPRAPTVAPRRTLALPDLSRAQLRVPDIFNQADPYAARLREAHAAREKPPIVRTRSVLTTIDRERVTVIATDSSGVQSLILSREEAIQLGHSFTALGIPS